MTRVSMEDLRRVALMAIAASLALGILLGLALGWQVWPVQWYNTDPSDLRVEHQETYVVMVADSLAVTGDVDLAQARLQELVDDDTNWEQVADLVEQVASGRDAAGDEAAGLRVRRLAMAAGLSTSPQEEFEPPRKRVAAAGRWLAYLLGIAVILVALAMAAWLLSRHIRERVPRRRPSPFSSRRPEQGGVSAVSGGLPPSESSSTVSIPEPPWGEARLSEPPLVEEDEEDHESEEMDISDEEEGEEERGISQSLGVFEAEYALGDEDFDCSFSLESPDGEFLGECGLGIANVLEGDSVQQVDAFEVWLFDKGDIRTVSKVLVSEYAYEDEDLRGKLGEKGELVMMEDGLTITLETLSLRVTATVSDYDYGEDAETSNSYFSRLSVELEAERLG